MSSDIDIYKNKLLEELSRIEGDLGSIAKRNPENPDDWQTIMPDLNSQSSDASELADKFEEYDTQLGIEGNLKDRLNNIKKALKKIEDGTYGNCEECNKPINSKRLEVNPEAVTCVEHTNNS